MKNMFWLDQKPSFWARLCALGVDYTLFYTVCCLISFFIPVYIDDLRYVLFALFLPLFWAPLEAFLISRFKTTPGRSLLGIRIETHTGDKLPYPIALKRSFCFGVRPGIVRQKALSAVRYAVAVCALLGLTGVSLFEKEIAVFSTGFEKYKTIEGWTDYTAGDGTFRVLFPETPEEESKVLPVPSQNKTLNYQEVTSHQTQKVYYSVSYLKIPGKWKMAGASRLLYGALELIVEHIPGAKLLEKTMTKYKSFKALDFHFSQGSEEVEGRLILVGTTLYRLTVVYPASLAHRLQKSEFLDSFEVLG